MITTFAEKLAENLNDLPGCIVQERMAPQHRPSSRDCEKYYATARLGGVLILFYPHDGLIRTVMIQRPTYPGVHSGQVAFPGGQMENTDINLTATAVREAHEEVGIDSNAITVLGPLTRLYIPPSNFLITPVVAYAMQRPDFVLEKGEVAGILEPSVPELIDEKAVGVKQVKVTSDLSIEAPYYDIQSRTVWGATAMMIAELNEILKRVVR